MKLSTAIPPRQKDRPQTKSQFTVDIFTIWRSFYSEVQGLERIQAIGGKCCKLLLPVGSMPAAEPSKNTKRRDIFDYLVRKHRILQ